MQFLERLVSFWGFGFMAVACSAFFFCLNRVVFRHLTSSSSEDPLPVFYIIMVRQITILVWSLPLASITKAPLFKFTRRQWIFLLIRCFVALATATTNGFAVSLISLPDLATIVSMTPLVTSFVSWPILKEPPRLTDFPAFIFMLVGVMFIVQPGFIFGGSASYAPPNMKGVLFAVASIAGSCTVHTCVRGLRGIHVASVNFIYGASTSIIAVVVNMIFFRRLPPCSYFLRFETLLIGLLTSCNVSFSLLAGRSLPANMLALGFGIELVLQLLIQLAFFKNPPKLFSLIGAGIVLVTFGFLAFRNFLLNHTETETKKARESGRKYEPNRLLYFLTMRVPSPQCCSTAVDNK